METALGSETLQQYANQNRQTESPSTRPKGKARRAISRPRVRRTLINYPHYANMPFHAWQAPRNAPRKHQPRVTLTFVETTGQTRHAARFQR